MCTCEKSLREDMLEQFRVIKVTGPPSLCLFPFYQIRKGQPRPLCWGKGVSVLKHRAN